MNIDNFKINCYNMENNERQVDKMTMNLNFRNRRAVLSVCD